MKRIYSSSRQVRGLTILIGCALLFSVLPLSIPGQPRFDGDRGAARKSTLYSSISESPSISSTVVINEIYAGGGCTTAGCALYSNDYVELKNIGLTPVNVTGWTVQYKSATGATTTYAASSPLSGFIKPGDTFLVVLAGGPAGTGVNPTPAGNGTGTLSLSNTAGRVALINSTTPLDATTPCATQVAAAVDLVGYGSTAICFEGTGPAPGPTSTATSVNRLTAVDTDQNSVDFGIAAPTPQPAAFPTASAVTISGRVLTADGRGVRSAIVTISGGELSEPISVQTGYRGRYTLSDIPAGASYVIDVSSRRFSFDSQIVDVQDNLTGVDFVAGDNR